ncbi:2-oxoacid:acceptor oxidoreductase subunit alpha [Sulfobacillus thermosulfidooxidans]|uniref:2-oxoacid:acceptor oxidoreductase subunit alpha n=1 Tax=Sulfobacillus thermosulfidooxidans TaxID=28034 RepID=UPI00030E6EFB|nr:2-oxoacid:acceptor oxidoreductase subunit alpha [Sulfobacillus thermosulfidooxidans]
MLAWKIGGDQGEGIDSTGDIVIHVANHLGYYVYGYKSFSSRIKGGHTNYKVRIANHPIHATTKRTDILIALNQETINLNHHELDGGIILADSAFSPYLPDDSKAFLVPLAMSQMAKDQGSLLMRNMIAVGASAALLGLPLDAFGQYIVKRFAKKGESIINANKRALSMGYEAIMAQLDQIPALPALGIPVPGDRIVLTGNDATALGALAAGCRIMCGYPITPATDIMEALAKYFPMVGGVVMQMEDELASITAAIGAGFAGVRAMTATSGPGLSLMQEAIGLAAMTETPVVIVDTQRAGPSTGMPTKQEQSDLLALIYGGHGEAPRIVITPSSVEEAFEDAYEAFNLADHFQTPVIIATDLSLALWQQTVERQAVDGPHVPIDRGAIYSAQDLSTVANSFRRYAFTLDDISPRTLPGMSHGQYLATGVEHGQNGKVSEDPINRQHMMDKRLNKVLQIHQLRTPVRYDGPEDADVVLLAIGSTVGINKEAKEILAKSGVRAAVAWLRTLSPFPKDQCQRFFAKARHILVVEQNATGQVAHLLKGAGLFDGRYHSLLKYDGVPFLPEEVAQETQNLLAQLEVNH